MKNLLLGFMLTLFVGVSFAQCGIENEFSAEVKTYQEFAIDDVSFEAYVAQDTVTAIEAETYYNYRIDELISYRDINLEKRSDEWNDTQRIIAKNIIYLSDLPDNDNIPVKIYWSNLNDTESNQMSILTEDNKYRQLAESTALKTDIKLSDQIYSLTHVDLDLE